MPTKRKYWGTVTPLPAPFLTAMAQQQEAAGMEGLFAPQVYGPPFIPLAVAAGATTRVRLATGIALAFARSPFETAVAAMDLDRISGGRFTLGLGTSVKSWSEGFFGMEYGKPVEHMREVVEIVRLVVEKSHTGELTRYDGKYHHLDFSEFNPLGAPARTNIPIWIAALRTPLIRLGAEIADGVIGHPIWSIEWAKTKVADDLKAGLAKSGRQRGDIEFNQWLFVAPNDDRKQAIEDARATVAFYGGVEQYEAYFAAHGFEKEAKSPAGRREARRLPQREAPRDRRDGADVCRLRHRRRSPRPHRTDLGYRRQRLPRPPSYGLEGAAVMGYASRIAAAFYE